MKQGDRVKLIGGGYNDSEWNPVWGGKYGKVIGTLFNHNTFGSDPEYIFSVEWDNRTSNVYRQSDLELYTQPVKLPDEFVKEL